MRNKRLIVPLCLVLMTPAVCAELKPFGMDSLARIEQAHQDQGFLLVLWSLDCPPCIKELGTLQSLQLPTPSRRLVLVSTDGEERRGEVEKMLEGFELADHENWLFADTYTERLRYRIDADWFGELPRSYHYDAQHQRVARSGRLNHQTLVQWLTSPQPSTEQYP